MDINSGIDKIVLRRWFSFCLLTCGVRFLFFIYFLGLFFRGDLLEYWFLRLLIVVLGERVCD